MAKNYGGSPQRRTFDQEINYKYYNSHSSVIGNTAKNLDREIIPASGGEILSGRQGVFICNNSAADIVYIGFSASVGSTSYAFPPLLSGDTVWIAASGGISNAPDTGIFLVSSGGATPVTITEVL